MNLPDRAGVTVLTLLLLTLSGGPAKSEDRELETALDGRALVFSSSAPETPTSSAPLVLVHGWASDRRVWRGLVDELGEHRVIALDLPGHGGSEEPVVDLDMELFARAVIAVMDEAGIPRAVLVGHSNGTPVVREVYRRDPERVAGLVVLDGPLRSFVTEEMAASVRESLAGDDWQQVVRGFVDGMPAPALTAEQRAEIRTMAVEQSQSAVVGGFVAALDPEIWRDDPIEVPTLVILAEQPSWSAEYLAWVGELVPELELHVWPGAGHFLMVERPAEVAELIAPFAERVALPASPGGR
jgi:pimeloyl-ACP methyl ester carboxylesterase